MFTNLLAATEYNGGVENYFQKSLVGNASPSLSGSGINFDRPKHMLEQFNQFDQFYLSELLLIKNKELTDGMKQGKKNKELRSIYEEIKLIYQEIKHRKNVLTGSSLPA